MRKLYPILGIILGALLLNACGNSSVSGGAGAGIHQTPLTDASGTCSRNAMAAGVPVVESGPCSYTFTPYQRMTTTQTSNASGVDITSTIIFDVATNKVFLKGDTTWDAYPVDAASLSEVSPYYVWAYNHLKNAKTVGTESVNGKQAQHVHGTLSVDDSATVDVWIGTDTGFPLKWIATLNQDNGGVVSTETILFDTWNTGEAIQLPA